MQQLSNYFKLSVPPSGNSKQKETKANLIRLLTTRLNADLRLVKGKVSNKEAWHYVLVDFDKKEQFLEKIRSGSMDVKDYGRILESGWGHDPPQDVKDKQTKWTLPFTNNFFLVRLQREGYEKNYYVMADKGKELEMMAASSVEHIRRCGKILYSSCDEDPIEALISVIEKTYFGEGEEISFTLDSRPFDAARNGEVQSVRDHLERGGDVDCTDENGWTMLHHAAHCGNIDIIRLLKDKGANIQIQDKICGRKPIHIAARESHNNIIEFFLKNGGSVNDTDKNNWSLLHYAAWKGNLKTAEFLIQNGAEINNIKDKTLSKKPIHIAAGYGNTDVVKILLEKGASIEDGDESGRTPFYYAALSGRLETAHFLIGKGADFNKTTKLGTKPIHAAASGNYEEMLKFLLNLGSNIDEQDGDGMTPLHRAASDGDLNTVQFLVDREANLNAVDKDGKIPFDYGKQHTGIGAYIANRLGKMLQEDQGKYCEAFKVYKEILEIQKEKLGHDHPETLKTHNEVAVVLYEECLYNEAVDTFKDVLRLRERCLGPNHTDTLCSKHGLGLAYSAQMKCIEAMDILKEVFEKREVNLGFDNHDTLNVARDMAYVHFKKGEYDEAFRIFKEVFGKRIKLFGADHPDTLQVSQDMAVVLVNKGDYKGALQTFKDVLEKRKAKLGNNHPHTICTSRHIVMISQNFEKELQEHSGCSIQ